MKLIDEILILKASKDVKHPFKFFSLAYLAIAFISLGGGFVYGIYQYIQGQPELPAIFIGSAISLALFILASWSHLEAKKCIK